MSESLGEKFYWKTFAAQRKRKKHLGELAAAGVSARESSPQLGCECPGELAVATTEDGELAPGEPAGPRRLHLAAPPHPGAAAACRPAPPSCAVRKEKWERKIKEKKERREPAALEVGPSTWITADGRFDREIDLERATVETILGTHHTVISPHL